MPGPDAARLRRWAGVLSFRTISGKLIIGLVVLFGLASAVVSVVTAQSLNNSLMSSLRTQVQSATSTWFTCANPDSDVPGGDQDQQGPPNCYASRQAPGTFLAVVSATGKVAQYHYVGGSCTLTAADQTMLVNLPAPGPPGSYPPHGAPPDPPTYTGTLASLGIEFMFTKVPGPGHTVLVTGLPLTTVNATLGHVENTEHVLFAVALGLAVILGAVLVQFSLRPLRRVAVTATKVTELPLDSGEVTLPAGVPDTDPRTEVGQVGAAFNRMLSHVERALSRRAASEARLRRFAADASHELRTPLSAIRGYAELALRHQGPVPEDVTRALTRVQSESARMSVLVDDLLLLARLDAGRPLAREPVDLSRLAIDVTSDARVARREHHWRLDLPSDPVLVSGDEHRLHQALANVMSNAGKHTPPGSKDRGALSISGHVQSAPGVDSRVTPDGGMVERGPRPAAPRVELSITDDG